MRMISNSAGSTFKPVKNSDKNARENALQIVVVGDFRRPIGKFSNSINKLMCKREEHAARKKF